MGKTALVMAGGGMRNAFASGVLIGAELRPEQFDACFVCSTAAHVAAFFAAGQIGLMPRLWLEEFSRPETFSFGRLLRGKRMGDVDYAIDQCCRELDLDAFAHAHLKLHIGIFCLRIGETYYPIATAETLRDILKATSAFPIATRPVFLNGDAFVDGGLHYTLPVFAAHRLGFDRILVVFNQPADFQMEPYGALASWLTFPDYPKARRRLQERAENLAQSLRFIHAPPPGTRVHFVAPDASLPAQRVCRSKDSVQATIDLGLAQGRAQKERIHAFLKTA